MGQLSFLSAEACLPGVADLAGLLCGPGQAMGFGRGTAARVSVVVGQQWRARVLAMECATRGVAAQLSASEDGHPLVRTAFRSDLVELASGWLRGAVKSVPAGFELDGAALRVWAVAAGRVDPRGYLLGLDPQAPHTHEPLVSALWRVGLRVSTTSSEDGAPVVRISGRRFLRRLVELVGPAPTGTEGSHWPNS